MKGLALAAQIADGLAAVPEAGVIHRDPKPDDVLLDRAPDASPQVRLGGPIMAGNPTTAAVSDEIAEVVPKAVATSIDVISLAGPTRGARRRAVESSDPAVATVDRLAVHGLTAGTVTVSAQPGSLRATSSVIVAARTALTPPRVEPPRPRVSVAQTTHSTDRNGAISPCVAWQ